jgi:hypothetical protein
MAYGLFSGEVKVATLDPHVQCHKTLVMYMYVPLSRVSRSRVPIRPCAARSADMVVSNIAVLSMEGDGNVRRSRVKWCRSGDDADLDG